MLAAEVTKKWVICVHFHTYIATQPKAKHIRSTHSRLRFRNMSNKTTFNQQLQKEYITAIIEK